ncbi:MAG: VpaChn25_0724 family phage protein [Rhizomicrobium sp.]
MTLENRPEDLGDIVAKHRRLVVLCLLMGPCGGGSNESVIADLVNRVGFRSTREGIRTCLGELEKSGAVKVDLCEALMVVRLTNRGEEIARGLISSDDVAEPGIECPYWPLK